MAPQSFEGESWRLATSVRLPARRCLTGANARRSIIADEHGVFEFIALPAGRCEVRAASAGYLTVKYGQSDAVAPPRYVEVGDGQLRAGVDVTLPDGGVIAVTVTDERGAPMETSGFRHNRLAFSGAGSSSDIRSTTG